MRVVRAARVQLVPSSIAARETSKRSRGRSTSLANRGAVRTFPRPWCPYYPYLSFIARSTESGPDFLPYTMLEGASYGKTR